MRILSEPTKRPILKLLNPERAYETTHLETVEASLDPTVAQELRYKLYEQVCITWRALVDVRFKLFALVPTISLLSLATVFGNGEAGKVLPSPGLKLLFAVLGLSATVGLLIYELRNSQLHDDLISRGRKIEDELGVATGVFKGRIVATGFVKHDTATFLIYSAAIIAWLAAVVLSARAV